MLQQRIENRWQDVAAKTVDFDRLQSAVTFNVTAENDGGETYYVDAVVKAKDRDTVALWLNKHKNFSYIQDERISRV